ncbi:MAG: CCA tRNA nucleotidyltransferase [Verrucomicrobia bacterium]|nr:CCA tRNA nucleotidyltransferase [Verrucomicrobiota bacterium]MBS0637398.1 CCA tRNA nucleotidyltransferase [Verrucomicrobiota bacterium]
MSHTEKLAKEIVTELKSKGFTAYFAGGFVRDKLLGVPSSDIDIATDALPEEIAAIFPEHFLVGAQFGVCVVRHKNHSFEVATFRQDVAYQDGRRPSQVLLRSTPEEDAKRRDFTVNGMFYDPISNDVIDYIGGQEDLKKGIIRTIGKAEERFEEDRLRMIRAIRFAWRLGFQIEQKTKKAILELSHSLLPSVSMERIWQEFQKIRQGPNFSHALVEMSELGLLSRCLPPLAKVSTEEIKARLSGLEMVSEKVPAILILAELFNPEDIPFVLGLGIYMRASKDETKWIETHLEIKGLWQQDPQFQKRFEWSQLLANKRAHSSLEVIFAKQPHDVKKRAEKNLVTCELNLAPHIERIHKKKPLCQAKDLQELGIHPGKKMGQLLQLAERLAIEHDLQSTEEVIQKLLQDPTWEDT